MDSRYLTGNVLDCIDCGHVTASPEVSNFAACPRCGSHETVALVQTPCPEPNLLACRAEDHRHTLGVHLSEPRP